VLTRVEEGERMTKSDALHYIWVTLEIDRANDGGFPRIESIVCVENEEGEVMEMNLIFNSKDKFTIKAERF
jgi:hypothetical protein